MNAAVAQNPTLMGHDEAMQQVQAAFSGGRMHHAWLISGIDGIGKTTLAYHIANHVLSSGQNPLGRLDLQHRITKLVMGDAHPDLLTIRRATDERTGELRNVIVVEDALKVAQFLHKTATHGGWRVVIIDEAHALNRHGQNAILKILEEPPARVLILMTATTPGALLPTIRSRCRALNLGPLDEAHMQAILRRVAPNLAEDEMQRLISLSGGSIGFALKIVKAECLTLYDELVRLLGELPALDISRLHKLADQMSRKADAESYEVVTSLLLDRLRTDAMAQARAGRGGFERKLQLWEKVRGTLAMADGANLDRKLALVNAVLEIRGAA